jgi:hypothetical protein
MASGVVRAFIGHNEEGKSKDEDFEEQPADATWHEWEPLGRLRDGEHLHPLFTTIYIY